MTPALKVALLGYGYAGRTFHAPLVRATAGLELYAVASSQTAAVRAALPAARVFAHPAQVLADPEVEVVVIATPNNTHAALAEAALLAGKHVVVDKPLACSLAEARHLAVLAEKCGGVLSIFQNRRWDSDFLALREVLQSGRIGRPIHLESRFDRFRPVVRDRWREKRAAGGGVWLDLGPHLVDQALQLFGLPQRVGGMIASMRSGAEADDWFQIHLDYGALQVTLSASMLVAGGIPRFALHGTSGSWVKHGMDVQEEQLRGGMVPGEAGWGGDRRPGCLFDEMGNGTSLSAPDGDYRRYCAAFRDAVLGSAPNPVPPAEAVATMAVLETAVEAVTAESWLSLPLTANERAVSRAESLPDLVAS